MFQIHIEYSSTTIWVKNSVEIALSLTISEILPFLGFPQKSKMAAKSGEKIEIFQFCIGYFAITLRFKNSVKITLSLAVSEILTFSVFRKNPRWPPKVAKLKYSLHTLWVKNSVQIALSLTVSEILRLFVFRKNSRWPPKVAKIEFFQFHIEYSATTLRVKNSVEIALSLTVSKILTFFVFPQNFKMAAKSGEN